jgi:hypothetical protein
MSANCCNPKCRKKLPDYRHKHKRSYCEECMAAYRKWKSKADHRLRTFERAYRNAPIYY